MSSGCGQAFISRLQLSASNLNGTIKFTFTFSPSKIASLHFGISSIVPIKFIIAVYYCKINYFKTKHLVNAEYLDQEQTRKEVCDIRRLYWYQTNGNFIDFVVLRLISRKVFRFTQLINIERKEQNVTAIEHTYIPHYVLHNFVSNQA